WIAASTHEGEEDAALAAHAAIRVLLPNALLVLVPRHPQRFDAVWRAITEGGYSAERRSRLNALDTAGMPQVLGGISVFLGDSMGEMFLYLAMADIAFVGGSFAAVGGHNILEPAALGLPVLFGPVMHNFAAARSLLLECSAALEVADTPALAAEVGVLLSDATKRAAMGAAGIAAVTGNRGALQRLLTLLDSPLTD
ncbi:MAG: 3-deoxy-D-manno-octulosonic acid transferase, partial [Nevskia sp.]|nr:3-deoxy-D-manno-octulosonic acid transferase [Nevskia sp.]